MTEPTLNSTQQIHIYILEPAVKDFAFMRYDDTRVDYIVNRLESTLREAFLSKPGGAARFMVALRVCIETFGRYSSLAKIGLVDVVGLGTDSTRNSSPSIYISSESCAKPLKMEASHHWTLKYIDGLDRSVERDHTLPF